MDEAERILEREIRHLACGILSEPERATLDRSEAEADWDASVSFRGHERMFS